MKTLLGLVLVGVAFSSFADDYREVSFQPCSFWQYDFTSHANVCQSLDSRVRMYESRDVDQMIRSLESKISQLEARVQKLESGGR